MIKNSEQLRSRGELDENILSLVYSSRLSVRFDPFVLHGPCTIWLYGLRKSSHKPYDLPRPYRSLPAEWANDHRRTEEYIRCA